MRIARYLIFVYKAEDLTCALHQIYGRTAIKSSISLTIDFSPSWLAGNCQDKHASELSIHVFSITKFDILGHYIQVWTDGEG